MPQYSLGDIKAFAPSAAPPVDFGTQGRVTPAPTPRAPSLLGAGPSLEELLQASGISTLSPQGVAQQTEDDEAAQEAAQLAAFEATPVGQFASTSKDLVVGAAKSVPRAVFNLAQGGMEYGPQGLAEKLVSAMTGREIPSDPVKDYLRESLALPTKAVPKPEEFAGLTDYLKYNNTTQQVGGVAGDIAQSLLIPGSRAAALAKVPGMTTKLTPAARWAARGGRAVREAVVGAAQGQASSRDPFSGAAYGAVFSPLGGRTAGEIQEKVAGHVKDAKQRISQMIAPSGKGNKRWVEKNAMAIIRDSPWFADLEHLQDLTVARVDKAGRQIQSVLANVRQPNVSGKIKSVTTTLQQAADDLLTKAGAQNVELAPKTREALEGISQGLGAIRSGTSTPLHLLQTAHDDIGIALSEIQQEVARRSAQISGHGAVRQAFDAAIGAGLPRQAERVARAGAAELGDVITDVAPSRIPTRQILRSLKRYQRYFMQTNDETGELIASNPQAVSALQELIDQIGQHGKDISVDTARSIRQQWDNIAAGPDGKGFLVDLAEESRRGAHKQGGNVFRRSIGQKVPGILDPNREYSWSANLRDAISDTLTRRTGQTKGPMAGVMAGIGTATGAGLGAVVGGVPGAAIGSMTGAGITHYLTRLVKSADWNLLSAKARVAVADALRSGRVDQLRTVAQRATREMAVIARNGGQVADWDDLTEAEEAAETSNVQDGLGATPGITNDGNPDDNYFPAPPVPLSTVPVEGEMPVEGEAPVEGEEPMPGEPGYVDPDDDEDENDPEVLQAGMGGVFQTIRRLAAPLNTPVVDLPRRPGSPRFNRLMEGAEMALTPGNLGFGAAALARPLAVGSRLAKPIDTTARLLSGATAVEGLGNVGEAVQTGNVTQGVVGAVQAGFGGLGARGGAAAPSAAVKATAARVAPLAQRLAAGLRAGGMDIAVGPGVVVGAQEIMDSAAMRRAIPDEQTRQQVGTYLQLAGIIGTGAAIASKGKKAQAAKGVVDDATGAPPPPGDVAPETPGSLLVDPQGRSLASPTETPTLVDPSGVPMTGRAKREAEKVAAATGVPTRNQAARAKAIKGYLTTLPKDVRASVTKEIKAAFPRLDSYAKPMAPVLPKRLLQRAEGLSPYARGLIETVVQGADPKRPIGPLELQALAAGKKYEPPRLIRPALPSNYNFKKTLPGAPLGVTTKAHENERLAHYLQLVEEGKAGADWYDKGGQAMLSHVGDDPQAARELAAVHSVTSPATDVVVNSGFAIKGHNQNAVGDEIETGRYPKQMSKEARKVYAGTSEIMQNLKRGPFYDALARRGGFGDENVPLRPTNDIWQAEAWGFANPDGTPMRKGFNKTIHGWMDGMTQRAVDYANANAVGGRTDWTLDRLQAAAWFGMKQRATAAEGKPPEAYADFETGLRHNYAQGGREAVPGTSTGHLAGIGDDPALKAAQDEAVYRATHDAQGRDRISLGYGALTGKSVRGPGVYAGDLSPGVQTQVATGIQRGKGKLQAQRRLDPASEKLLNAIEATYALTFGQSMAAHGRFLPDSPANFRNAIKVTLGRVPTDAEFLKLGEDLRAAGFGDDDIAQIFGPTGYTLKGTHDDEGLLTPDQIKRLRGVATAQGHTVNEPGYRSGKAVFNDWSKPGQEYGQRYYKLIEPMRERFDAMAKDLVARAEAADAEIVKLTGGKFKPSENIVYLRQVMADEGFAGLERIAEQFGVSVVLLAAALGLSLPDEPVGDS